MPEDVAVRTVPFRGWRRFGLAAKLGLGFASVLAVTAALGVVVSIESHHMRQQVEGSTSALIPVNASMAKLQETILRAKLAMRSYGFSGKEADFADGTREVAQAVALVATLSRQVEALGDPEMPGMARAVGAGLQAYAAEIARTRSATEAVAVARSAAGQAGTDVARLLDQHLGRIRERLENGGAAADGQLDRLLRLVDLTSVAASADAAATALLASAKSDDPAPVATLATAMATQLAALRAVHEDADDQARVDAIAKADAGRLAAVQAALAARRELGAVSKARAAASDGAIVHLAELDKRVNEATDANAKDLVGDMTSLSWLVAVGTLIAVGVGASLAALLTRSLTRPVRETMAALDQVAGGDLTVTLPVRSADELGRMAGSLNRTVGVLRHHRNSSAEVANSLSASAQELASTSEELVANANETTTQANTVASAAEQVSVNIRTVAAASEELSASVREIAGSSEQAAQIAGQAKDLSRQADSVVKRLGASSIEIGSVVKTISAIAQKTNLLALNATIEAASAGEAGRGFAVVAKEVKELARQTADATADIGKRIAGIQGDSAAAVQSLDAIGAIIARIDELQQSIAAAVQQQSATTQDISRTVTEAAKGAGEIAGNIGQVATATSATTEAASHVSQTSAELAQLATRLQELVSSLKG